MKKLLLYLSLLIPVFAYGQGRTNDTIPCTGCSTPISGFLKGPTNDTITRRLFLAFGSGKSMEIMAKSQVRAAIASAAPVNPSFTILQAPHVGDVIASGSSYQQLVQIFAPSQPPFASLTGGGNLELTSASTGTSTLSYSYGKNAGTLNLASATINGSTTGVTQATGGASGMISKTYSTNTTTTYTLVATTVDSKTASSSTSFAYFGKLYTGRAVTGTATSSEILASAGGQQQLTNSHNGTWTVTASGSNHPFIAYPANLGTVTQFKDGNGADITTLFVLTTPSFTNASGYTQTYNLYTFLNSTAGDFTFVSN